MATILVADDEARIRQLVSDFLKAEGHEVLTAADGEEALAVHAQAPHVDLVVLDVMMPRLDGWVVLRELRARSSVRVILLTARVDERDELLGYELGVDDYVHKPFSPKLLLSRIRALLRRSSESAADGKTIACGDLVIDVKHHVVTVAGVPLELSPREFGLLAHLARHPGEVFSRGQLLAIVWGTDYVGEVRTVDTHVKKLRAKLGASGDVLETVRGFGYRMAVS